MSYGSSWSDVFDDLDPLFSSRRSPTDAEIVEIVDRFVEGGLSNAEAEAALERLGRAKKRVLPVVMDLCRSDRPDVYHVGLMLLKEVNLTQAKMPLRELLEDPSLDDDHKMGLLSALEAVGGIAPGENPLLYLRDPEAAFRKSHEAFLDSLQDPFQLNILLEHEFGSDGYKLLQPSVLESMASTQDRRLLPLLLCLVHVPEDGIVLAAIEALTVLGDGSVVPVLEERAAYDGSPRVRKAAREAASMLSGEPVAASASIFHLPVAPPPVVRCLVSTIDGNGGQICLVIRQDADGERVCLDVMFNDREGIKDCVAGRGETVQELERALVDGMGETGIEVVDIGLPQARAELERAYGITMQMRRRLPPIYMAWRSWLCGEDASVPAIYSIPEVRPEERDALLARSGDLLDLEEFASWVFESFSLGDLERKYKKVTRRGGGEDTLEQMITQALARHTRSEWCEQLKNRLERQAWLLAQVYEDEEIPKMALAAATALGRDSHLRPAQHPMLREMMRRTMLGLRPGF